MRPLAVFATKALGVPGRGWGLSRIRVMSTSSAPSSGEEAAKAETKQKRLIVFGGNGYVGQAMIREALQTHHAHVISVNRSGPPSNFTVPQQSHGRVDWISGDAYDGASYREVLQGCDGAISCIGAFGSNQMMEKVNGDTNIQAIRECFRAGIPRFVYVSTVENNLPAFLLHGYFNGKRRAEEAVRESYPQSGVILRPGFIYGNRGVRLPIVGNVAVPLGVVGKPLEMLFSTQPFNLARSSVPGMQAILAPPVAVETLARTAVSAALGTLQYDVGADRVMRIEDIKRAASESQR
eukprot:gene32730-39568_t